MVVSMGRMWVDWWVTMWAALMAVSRVDSLVA